MDCKNCTLPLRTDYSYCSNCGAKIIRNRLTAKNLWYDITERYFNVDNTFLKTIWALFKKPEVVILGYIEGVRKKYVNPISYYAIALTLTGLLYFLVKEFFMDQLSMEWMGQASTAAGEDIFDGTIKYQSIISILSIPLYALLSKIVFFDKKKLNFTEHIVTHLHLIAQYTIISFPIMLIVLLIGVNYMIATYIGLFFYVIYTAYCFKRIFELSLGKIILRTGLFGFILIFFYIAGVILFMLTLYLTGGVEALKTLAPPSK